LLREPSENAERFHVVLRELHAKFKNNSRNSVRLSHAELVKHSAEASVKPEETFVRLNVLQEDAEDPSREFLRD